MLHGKLGVVHWRKRTMRENLVVLQTTVMRCGIWIRLFSRLPGSLRLRTGRLQGVGIEGVGHKDSIHGCRIQLYTTRACRMDRMFIAHVKAFVPFFDCSLFPSQCNEPEEKRPNGHLTAGLLQHSLSHRFIRAADPLNTEIRFRLVRGRGPLPLSR